MNLVRNSTTNGAWRTWKNCKAIQCVIAPFQAKVRKTGNTVTSAASYGGLMHHDTTF